jgi:hypothetical protein
MIFEKSDLLDLAHRQADAAQIMIETAQSLDILLNAGPEDKLSFTYEFHGMLRYGSYEDGCFTAQIEAKDLRSAIIQLIGEYSLTAGLSMDWEGFLDKKLGPEWTTEAFFLANLELEDDDRMYRFGACTLLRVRKETVKGL